MAGDRTPAGKLESSYKLTTIPHLNEDLDWSAQQALVETRSGGSKLSMGEMLFSW